MKALDTQSLLRKGLYCGADGGQDGANREDTFKMEPYIPLIIAALGGTILGPIVTRLLGGRATVGIFGGVVGGIAAHYVADYAGVGPLLGTDPMLVHIQNFLEGGVGGGILGLVAGLLLKGR